MVFEELDGEMDDTDGEELEHLRTPSLPSVSLAGECDDVAVAIGFDAIVRV